MVHQFEGFLGKDKGEYSLKVKSQVIHIKIQR